MEESTKGSKHGLSLPRFVLLVKVPRGGRFPIPKRRQDQREDPGYGRGRICEASGCDTLLSTYNLPSTARCNDFPGAPRPRP